MKKWRWNFDYWTAILTKQTEPFPYHKERDFFITEDMKCSVCEYRRREDCQISCGKKEYQMTYCEIYTSELEEEGKENANTI